MIEGEKHLATEDEDTQAWHVGREINHVCLLTPHHVAVLHDWLLVSGELFIHFEYPHSGGSGRDYFVRSLEDIRNLVSQQTHPEIEITIFRPTIFPFRGTDHPALLERALREIPDGQFYRIVVPNHYPRECEILADGEGHDQLRKDVARLDPTCAVAIGVHPFDIPSTEFDQQYGRPVERLDFHVHKNLNFYPEFSDNPEKYRSVMERWFGPEADLHESDKSK